MSKKSSREENVLCYCVAFNFVADDDDDDEDLQQSLNMFTIKVDTSQLAKLYDEQAMCCVNFFLCD